MWSEAKFSNFGSGPIIEKCIYKTTYNLNIWSFWEIHIGNHKTVVLKLYVQEKIILFLPMILEKSLPIFVQRYPPPPSSLLTSDPALPTYDSGEEFARLCATIPAIATLLPSVQWPSPSYLWFWRRVCHTLCSDTRHPPPFWPGPWPDPAPAAGTPACHLAGRQAPGNTACLFLLLALQSRSWRRSLLSGLAPPLLLIN